MFDIYKQLEKIVITANQLLNNIPDKIQMEDTIGELNQELKDLPENIKKTNIEILETRIDDLIIQSKLDFENFHNLINYVSLSQKAKKNNSWGYRKWNRYRNRRLCNTKN